MARRDEALMWRADYTPPPPPTETGTIDGRVLGLDGSAVKEALVTTTDPAGNKWETTSTGKRGSYALTIGAGNGWRVALVRAPAPLLTIVRNAEQTVSLSWSGAGVLEQAESLTALNWQPAPSQANPQTLSTTNLMKFYRVKAE